MFALLFFSATTSQKNADLDAVTSRMEVLVASIKRRSQRLYKDTDGSKGRARIRRKIREEKAILSSVVEKYNSMVPDTERIAFDIILSDETVWPWQLSHRGMYTNLLTILFDSHSSTKPIMPYHRLFQKFFEKYLQFTYFPQLYPRRCRFENQEEGV